MDVVLVIILLFGIYIAAKGYHRQRQAFLVLGTTLAARKKEEFERTDALSSEEEALFLSSLSGIRWRIVGILFIAIPASLIILLHL